ncbi:MAG: YigZ family protein [Muribaculaceae bacterium]|nr:YigZ family protein [Muribaculaceae bacterium]
MSDLYYTIKGTGSSQYKEKMSRFLSFALPVHSADEAKSEIKRLQNEYHDARHVCWAYMIGPDRLEWQLNDNGEPSGTAGKPILGQINSFNVTDILIVVVRYFGGIKLGTSGLISAYKEAAKLAIEEAGIKEMHKMCRIKVSFPYMCQDGVMRVAKQDGVETLEKNFDNLCHVTLEFAEDLKEEITGKLSKVEGASVEEVEEDK